MSSDPLAVSPASGARSRQVLVDEANEMTEALWQRVVGVEVCGSGRRGTCARRGVDVASDSSRMSPLPRRLLSAP